MTEHTRLHTGSSTGQATMSQIQVNVIKTMILVSALYVVSWMPHNIFYNIQIR